jgi:hypothetical protein
MMNRRMPLCRLILAVGASAAVSALPPPIALKVVSELTLPVDASAFGVALARGVGGEIFILVNNPPRILRWASEGAPVDDTGGIPGTFQSPTDISVVSGDELLVADPWQAALARYTRRLQAQPSISPGVGSARFEPVSAAAGRDGSLYILNRADGDIWRLSQGGNSVPLRWSSGSGGVLRNPSRIRFAFQTEKLIIIDGRRVIISDPLTGDKRLITLSFPDPAGVALIPEELWAAGSEIAGYDPTSGQLLFRFPNDSLRAMGVGAVADILPEGNTALWALTTFPPSLLKLQIIRDGTDVTE